MEKDKKPVNHERRQNQRLAICIALAELFQKHLGADNGIPEPYLENEEDEKSDLILDLDFGPELKGEARFSYEGGVQILKNEKLKKLFFYFRERFEKLLEQIQLDSKDVIIEEA
jgi:hypothetical protein